MAKRILILVGIPHFNYYDEKSAVALFLKQVKTALEDENTLVDFPDASDEVLVPSKSVQNNSGVVKNILKRWNWGYQTLSYEVYRRKQDVLLSKLLNKKPYDHVVEFHTVGSTIGKVLANKWKAKLSVIFDSPVHEQFVEMKKTKTLFWNHIKNSEREIMEAADRIMAYSPACKDYLMRRYKIKATMTTLPCVVSKQTVERTPPEDVFTILFIGSFLSWHKVDLLVKAFKEVLKSNEKARLQLIGFGEEWANIQEYVKFENLEEQIEMPGFVSENELNQYKAKANIAIMPGSNWYGSPLKLFEYAQSGIPFIAPQTPTVKSIFSEEHCLFIDSSNELTSLIACVQSYAASEKLRIEKQTRATELYADRFASTRYHKQLKFALINEEPS